MRYFQTYKLGVLVAVLAIVVGSIWLLERPVEISACTHTGDSVYDLVFSNSRGSCVELSEFRAPVAVFNVWASWCPFCVEELPDFGVVAEEFPDVPIVAINRAERFEDATAFLDSVTVSEKVVFLFDPEDSFYTFIQGFGMPETVFVDAQGNILLHKRGVMTLEEMRDTLQLLTGRSQPNADVHNDSLCVGDGDSCRIDTHTL